MVCGAAPWAVGFGLRVVQAAAGGPVLKHSTTFSLIAIKQRNENNKTEYCVSIIAID